jgi:hypothetical protein
MAAFKQQNIGYRLKYCPSSHTFDPKFMIIANPAARWGRVPKSRFRNS